MLCDLITQTLAREFAWPRKNEGLVLKRQELQAQIGLLSRR